MAPAGLSVAERDDPCCAVAKQNLSGRASETEKGPSQGDPFFISPSHPMRRPGLPTTSATTRVSTPGAGSVVRPT